MKEESSSKVMFVVGIVALLLVGFFIATLMTPKIPNEINVVTGDAEEFTKTLSTTGTVEKMVSPDQAEIYLSVETLDKQASISQENNATISEQVRAALKNAGVKDSQIETTYYAVQEQFEWQDSWSKQVSTGYKTTNSIKITITNLTKTGTIIDAAVSAGANNVSSINFTLSKAAQETAKQEALVEAAAMAKTKAQSMASGLGITLGEVQSVSENSYYYTPNYRSYDMMAVGASEAKAETPVSPSDVSVSATVNVVYELN